MSNKQSLKQTYNKFAEIRDSSDIAQWKSAERGAVLQYLHKESAVKLLEIGAGPGRDSLYFQENGLDVTAIDLSDEMVRLCQNKGIDARVMDFYELNFPDGTFDAVYAMNCLLHVAKKDIGSVYTEIRRVLKPGGLFFCGVYGGQDTEGIWEKDNYEPKRFFAMYEDEDIVQLIGEYFEIVDFHTVDMGEDAPHFQSLLLRKEG